MKRHVLLVLFTATLLTACSSHSGKHRSSSIVDLLYGKEQVITEREQQIELSLPLTVGVAFVPGADGHEFPSEAELQSAAESVRQKFAQEAAIKRIQVIPSYHLKGRRGFDSVAELGRLYNIDVLALISYDQVVNQASNNRSFWYLTVVGAYLVDGQQANIHTFTETAVFDLRSRQLLFSAPGYDQRKLSSNLSDVDRQIRVAQAESFSASVEQMNGNLTVALEQFKEDVREDGRATIQPKQRAKIADQAAYSNGGSVKYAAGSLPELVIFGALLLIVLRFTTRKMSGWLQSLNSKSK